MPPGPKQNRRRKPLPLGREYRSLPEEVKTALQPLNHQRRKFVMAYCGSCRGNMTEAAREAGYSPRSASMMGSWLLMQPEVVAAKEAWMAYYAMQASEVTWRLGDLAQAHLGPFLDYDPVTQGIKWAGSPEDWKRYRHWIKSVKVDPETNRVSEITLHDATRALDLLARINKQYSDAPQINFVFAVKRMSDADLLAEVEALHARLGATRTYLALGPGAAAEGEIVVEAPASGNGKKG